MEPFQNKKKKSTIELCSVYITHIAEQLINSINLSYKQYLHESLDAVSINTSTNVEALLQRRSRSCRRRSAAKMSKHHRQKWKLNSLLHFDAAAALCDPSYSDHTELRTDW